jgi:NADH-quinone oxidoreductase subunit L
VVRRLGLRLDLRQTVRQTLPAISHILRKDPLDQTIGLIPRMARRSHRPEPTETGQLRWYAASMAAGAVLVIGAVVVVAV